MAESRLAKKIVLLLTVFISLIFFANRSEAAQMKLKVIVAFANVRANPVLTSPILKVMPNGSILECEAKEGSWYKVNLPPDSRGIVITGYIHESIVKVIEPAKEIKEIPKNEQPIKGEVVKKEEAPKPVPSYGYLESRPAKGGILFSPLGFLQLGPIVEVEIGLGANIFLVPHFRYSALGLAFHLLNSDSVSMGSMAVGLGIKYFLKNPASPNRFYFGGFGEFGWGGTYGDVGTSTEWQGNNTYLDGLLNFGYRWRFSSKFLLNLGLMAGGAVTLTDDWWYLNDPSTIFKNDTKFYFVGMLELSLGWEW